MSGKVPNSFLGSAGQPPNFSLNSFSKDNLLPGIDKKKGTYIGPPKTSTSTSTPRFKWISEHQNEVAMLVALIALVAIAATGIGLMVEGTLFAVGFALISVSFVGTIVAVVNIVCECIWNRSR